MTRTDREVCQCSWEMQCKSTWQTRCVLLGSRGVGDMRYAYQLAQILRAQDTRSHVSSSSVLTESISRFPRPQLMRR